MGNVNDQNTCLKATRGELLCLRNIDKEKREVPVSEAPTDPSHSPLAALLESTDFPDFGFALQLIKVTPGSELGAMDRLRAEADVIAVSLNYIGESAGLLRFRKPEPRRNEWRMLSDDPAPSPSRSVAVSDYLRVLVIDVEPAHCQKVMRAVALGARSIPDAPLIEIIGRSLGQDGVTLATLHEYVTLLLQGALIGGRILAINMSVDWGVACDHGAPLANEVSTVSVSFPFFEHILARVHRCVRERNARAFAGTPAFFAAAGNQRGGLRWRMAYPAVRPNVIAATFVSPGTASSPQDEAVLSPSVDCPAVFDVKPCFGVSGDGLPEDLRNGSSFACAWLAGYYAALAARDSDGLLAAAPTFSKTALLQTSSVVRSLITSPRYWACPSVSVLKQPQANSRPLTSLTRMIAALNKLDVDVEFLVTGSMAMIDVLLANARQDWSALRDVSRAFGDIDVVQSTVLPSEKQVHAVQIVSEWLKQESGGRNCHLDLCLLERRISAPMLAQCIVPASQLLITAAGVVDANGGQQDIESRQLRIHLPGNRNVWDMNPQFLSEGAGMALGILIWIDLSLVMQIASHALGVTHGPPLESKSVGSVRTALAAMANDVDARRQTFGGDPAVGEERLGRRMARAHSLLRIAKRHQLDVSIQTDLLRLLEDAPIVA